MLQLDAFFLHFVDARLRGRLLALQWAGPWFSSLWPFVLQSSSRPMALQAMGMWLQLCYPLVALSMLCLAWTYGCFGSSFRSPRALLLTFLVVGMSMALLVMGICGHLGFTRAVYGSLCHGLGLPCYLGSLHFSLFIVFALDLAHGCFGNGVVSMVS